MPTTTATAHINLRGTAREALAFYQAAFGGEVTLVTYADAHAARHPDDAALVMWGQAASPDGFRVMAYDVPTGMPWNAGENAYFVSVGCDSPEAATQRWGRLADGATIVQPLAPSSWSPLYGMLKDKFGVTWVINVAAA